MHKLGFLPASVESEADAVVLRAAAMISGRLDGFRPGDGRLTITQDGGGVAVEATPESGGSFHVGPLPLGVVWLAWSVPRMFLARDQVRQTILRGPEFDIGVIRLRPLGHVAFQFQGAENRRVFARVFWPGQQAVSALEWPLLRGKTTSTGVVRFSGIHFDPTPRALLWLDSGEQLLVSQLDVHRADDGVPTMLAANAPGTIQVSGVGIGKDDALRILTVPARLPFARLVAVALDNNTDVVEYRVRSVQLRDGRPIVLRKIWAEPVFVVVISAQGLVLDRHTVEVLPGALSVVTLHARDYRAVELRSKRSAATCVAITSEWGCVFVDVPAGGMLPVRVGSRIEYRALAAGRQYVLRVGQPVLLED